MGNPLRMKLKQDCILTLTKLHALALNCALQMYYFRAQLLSLINSLQCTAYCKTITHHLTISALMNE